MYKLLRKGLVLFLFGTRVTIEASWVGGGGLVAILLPLEEHLSEGKTEQTSSDFHLTPDPETQPELEGFPPPGSPGHADSLPAGLWVGFLML